MPVELWALQVGPVKVTAIQAAIGAVVTFVVGAALVWLQRVLRRWLAAWWAARQDRRHADHATIGTGWWYGDLVGASTELLVCVRAAPAKTLPAPVRLAVERIAPFVSEAFGDRFPPGPEISDPTEVVRYRRKDTGHPGVDQVVNVWPSGLIEATVAIPRSNNDAGELVAPLIEMARGAATGHPCDPARLRADLRARRCDPVGAGLGDQAQPGTCRPTIDPVGRPGVPRPSPRWSRHRPAAAMAPPRVRP